MASTRTPELSAREVRLLRLGAQRLLPGFEAGSVADAAIACLTIQAQDPPWAALAIRSRTSGLTLEDARAQAADPAVCRAWLMRNTIHMFASEDLAWMRPLLAERPLRPAINRCAQLGVSEAELDRLLGLLRDRIAQGPLPRPEARTLLTSAGLEPGEGSSRIYWLFHVAALRGVLAVRPALENRQSFVAPAPDRPLDRDEGYARLARRFLEAYGPATPRDLAYWSKVTVTDARAGFAAAGELEEVETERGSMWALPGRLDPPRLSDPLVQLLPIWENHLLGYQDRTLAVPEPHDRVPGAGKPVALLDGRALAHWRLERMGGEATVVVEPFGRRLPAGAREGLEAEAEDVGRFLGVPTGLRIERPA